MSDQPDSEVVQQLERIAKAIRALEGMPVRFSLARKLSDLLKDIVDECVSESKRIAMSASDERR